MTDADAPGGPIVSLERVDVRLAGARVLSEVSLVLRRGEGVAVLGANGSGKSTLLRLLRGELWPDPPSPGRRLFHGADGAWESPIGVRERLARVAPEAQDAYLRNDWDVPVEAVIRSGFHDALWPAEAATPAQAARIREVAAATGVAHLLGRSILEVSRGEARRALVARALAPAPLALLLDEVCDGLDAPARADLLARVAAVLAGGTAVVMATHRPEEVVPGIGRVLRMEGGRIVWEGTREELGLGLDRHRDGPPHPDLDLGLPLGLPPHPDPLPPLRGGRGRMEGATAFLLRSATVLVAGRAVLDDASLEVRAGERWNVTGPNGAGKSTLLRLLAGEEQPARGEVVRLGLARAGADDLRGRIGLVSPELQARHRLDGRAEDVVLSGFAGTIGLAVAPTGEERVRARAAADRLGISALLPRRIHALSYGELRKVLLARALAPGPAALLLDEPLAGLDAASRAFVLRVVAEAARAGTAVVSVSHHEDELPRDPDGRATLAAGRLETRRAR